MSRFNPTRGTYAPQVGETFRECKHLTALSANGLAGRYVVDWFRSDSVGLIALCANCSAQTLLGHGVELSIELKTLTGYRRCESN